MGPRLTEELEEWTSSRGPHTLGSLTEAFGEKSFAILFVVLLGVPALPLPTGGVTHLFELVAMLLALELVVGRRSVWLPERWRRISLDGPTGERLLGRLMRMIRWLERRSRPRVRVLVASRPSNAIFGMLVLIGSAAAFLAPPFSTLDTLPALGVVVLSVGVLLGDALIAAAGVAIGAGGITLILALGRAAIQGLGDLF